MTDTERLADLKAKLASRKLKGGYEENQRELEAEIARLEVAASDAKE